MQISCVLGAGLGRGSRDRDHWMNVREIHGFIRTAWKLRSLSQVWCLGFQLSKSKNKGLCGLQKEGPRGKTGLGAMIFNLGHMESEKSVGYLSGVFCRPLKIEV